MHDKDAWGCGFCACLLTSWEERCEHIALHFEEKGATKWKFTNVILGLLRQTEIAHAWQQMMSQRHGDEKNWPTLSWESKKCNRLRYKLETKWDTRACDTEKLVQDTYDLAEIDVKDFIEPTADITPEISEPASSNQGEIVEFKLETSDYGSDQKIHSSHGLPPDHNMMDIDSIEAPHPMQQQGLQQTQWPVSQDIAQTHMGVYPEFDANLTTLSTDFSQPLAQSFSHQQTWPNTDFASTPDLMNYQSPTAYINYDTPKEMVSVPTSQYTDFAHYPRQSLPPNFIQQQQQQQPSGPMTPPASRRYVPKLVNISNSTHRGLQQEQPPPPPPKDENSQNRFSRMIMRRRPSNISQHSLVSHREMGGTWGDELTWG